MEEENIQEPEQIQFNDYLPSAGIVGLIFSVITFAIGIAMGYYQIGADPSGSFVSPMMLSGVFICLIGILAGAVAVWHFTKEVTPYMKLGQGALLGFITGVVIVLISAVFNEIWHFIDPAYTDKLVEATIANVEAMDMPESSKNDMIDGMAESVRSQQSFSSQLVWGIPINGILNLISGMVGVKLFAQNKEEETF